MILRIHVFSFFSIKTPRALLRYYCYYVNGISIFFSTRHSSNILFNISLQSISKPLVVTNSDVISDDVNTPKLIRQINSNVISASVPGTVVKELNDPVQIIFEHKQVRNNFLYNNITQVGMLAKIHV